MINVLSLFDGMAGARIALDRLGIECNYYASEIERTDDGKLAGKYAMQIAKANYPDIIHIGDVRDVKANGLPKIDLLIGGSPCQDLSIAKSNREGLAGSRSGLFWEYARLLRECKPKYFLLENVYRMPKEAVKIISEAVGVSPIMINSALLTAQNRERYYWTNTGVFMQPADRGILLKDILEILPDCPIGIKVRERSNCLRVGGINSPFGSKQIWDSPLQRISISGKVKPGISKSACLTGGANSGGHHSDMDIIHNRLATRRYSVTECERLQGVPEGYTQQPGISRTQAIRALGNGFTVPVIEYILSYMRF